MKAPKVGVDVTAHKEEHNVTDAKKKMKLRVRYYVELVVGLPRESHTRLGFSGSFQALLRLHRDFVRLYVEKHGDPHSGLLTGRESFLSNSSSTSRSSVSSTSKSSPTSLSSLVRHTFGLKKKSKSTGDANINGEGSANNQHTRYIHHHRHHHHQYPTTQEPPIGIVPFPAQNKMLVHLETGEAKDDDKIEARNAALFEYYSQCSIQTTVKCSWNWFTSERKSEQTRTRMNSWKISRRMVLSLTAVVVFSSYWVVIQRLKMLKARSMSNFSSLCTCAQEENRGAVNLRIGNLACKLHDT
ncbi:uncharacterized protein PITG_16309 [Phytophthora infestans T30-4]|uniref:Transmembrane protein n=1 Tax=Phytophthora infestans (strain T30-4) TaxID=403677 RepID=D0NTZ1_PHYIT|nr:uncharacterized protein PITG_16309 [Phytophthora infestans T30-4]EEY65115.1 conserved hypothetical protein [Phytophthora infestans T30-4]|eukprot:XP_002897372.1 conserved hypothetical protein [Phytophthora infestans T30-4]